MMGLPLFAFWNIYATRILFSKARYYIFSYELIHYCIEWYGNKYRDQSEFKDLIYEVMAQIALAKREFNSSHYYLSVKILGFFSIPFQSEYIPAASLNNSLNNLPSEIRKDLVNLFIAGMILDGSLNRRERKVIEELRNNSDDRNELLENSSNFLASFQKGEGVSFFQKHQ